MKFLNSSLLLVLCTFVTLFFSLAHAQATCDVADAPKAAVFRLPNLETTATVTRELIETEGTFCGTATITCIYQDGTELIATGFLTNAHVVPLGESCNGAASKSIADLNNEYFVAPFAVVESVAKRAALLVDCDILFLQLGPIHLELLGLEVDISLITIDIDAVPGAGNLLGNLLCGLVGLLDPATLLDALNALIRNIRP
jgi:hypothetical protein